MSNIIKIGNDPNLLESWFITGTQELHIGTYSYLHDGYNIILDKDDILKLQDFLNEAMSDMEVKQND